MDAPAGSHHALELARTNFNVCKCGFPALDHDVTFSSNYPKDSHSLVLSVTQSSLLLKLGACFLYVEKEVIARNFMAARDGVKFQYNPIQIVFQINP